MPAAGNVQETADKSRNVLAERRIPRMERVGSAWTHDPLNNACIRFYAHSNVASYRALGRLPLDFQQFYFSSLWSKSDIGQQLSISTALVTKLLVIEQLLQPALKFAVSAP